MKFRDSARTTLSKHVKFGNSGDADCRESPTGFNAMPTPFKPDTFYFLAKTMDIISRIFAIRYSE